MRILLVESKNARRASAAKRAGRVMSAPVALADTACCAAFLRRMAPVRILFPRFKEDAPDIHRLAEWLCLQAINYVIPRASPKLSKLCRTSQMSTTSLCCAIRPASVLLFAELRVATRGSTRWPGKSLVGCDCICYRSCGLRLASSSTWRGTPHRCSRSSIIELNLNPCCVVREATVDRHNVNFGRFSRMR